MAVKAGQIIHVGNDTVVVDRIQTAGPGTLNVPVETVYELGNYKSVGQIRDIPDLSFSMASYDVSTEIEALLLGLDHTDPAIYPLDPARARPLDMKSVFKAGANDATDPFRTVDSVGIPYLTLETLSYRFGVRDDAQQTATLRGDSVYYNPGSTYVERTPGTGAAGQTVVTAHPAFGVEEGGVFRRVLSVMAGTKRLVFGIDYTEAYGAVANGAAVATLTFINAVAATDEIQIMYSSPTVEEFPQTVHEGVAVKPAALRGRDIWVYLGGYDPANPYANRLQGVQSVTADWRVTLQQDQEFGNYHYVAQDYDVPTVSGTVGIKPADAGSLIALMQKVAGVTDLTQSATASTAPVLPFDVCLHDPVSGAVLKRIEVPDARLTVPGFSARVQQKLEVTINWNSDQGQMLIHEGDFTP